MTCGRSCIAPIPQPCTMERATRLEIHLSGLSVAVFFLPPVVTTALSQPLSLALAVFEVLLTLTTQPLTGPLTLDRLPTFLAKMDFLARPCPIHDSICPSCSETCHTKTG